MRKLVMWNLQSLDGCFEGAKTWDLDFHDTAWGDDLQRFSLEQLEEVGALLFGRTTYEGMASYWSTATGTIADAMNALPKVVFSRTLESADWSNSRLVRGDAAAEVAALKNETGKDLFLFGSAELSESLMREGLFDELRICIAPVVLGVGTPLFKPGSPRRDLELIESRAVDTGAVILRYAVEGTGA